MSTELPSASAATLAETHAREHPACFACGSVNAPGLGLSFRLSPDGSSVLADWLPPEWTVSYDGTVHGGLIATALDGAMVHALFARGCAARTAELRLRYRHTVKPSLPCHILARLVGKRGGALQLEATLHQAGLLRARAAATFMNPPA